MNAMQVQPYTLDMRVRWSDMDPNGHVRHSAYLDYAAHIRICYFEESDYPVSRLDQERIGPVLFSESIDYRRELKSAEKISCDISLVGLSKNQKHWLLRHHVYKASGELAAILNCRGAWLHLDNRCVIPATNDLYASLLQLQRTDDFEWI